MINYSERFVSSFEFTECLSFDPIEYYKNYYHNKAICINDTNKDTLKVITFTTSTKKLISRVIDNTPMDEDITQLLDYYKCSEGCFITYKQAASIPIKKFDYYSSCECIYSCFQKFNV
jgi:hypothetical protein